MNMKTQKLAILNFIALGFHMLMSYLVQMNYFSSLDVGQVSAKFDTVFAPAGITFAIWGVIYLSLLVFTIGHVFYAFRGPESFQVNKDTVEIGILFILNNIATGLWLLAWVNEQLLFSLILILIQLITLILISIKAHISNPDRPLITKIITHFPLSIYFAWINVATIANFSAYLKASGLSGSESLWTVIMIGIVCLLSMFIILVRRNIFYGFVIVWALYGVILKREQVNEIIYEDVITAAYAAIFFVVLAIGVRLLSILNPAVK